MHEKEAHSSSSKQWDPNPILNSMASQSNTEQRSIPNSIIQLVSSPDTPKHSRPLFNNIQISYLNSVWFAVEYWSGMFLSIGWIFC